MKIAADLHMHTRHSIDGENQLEEMCRKAIEIGLKTVCFTEHLDQHPQDDGYGFYNFEAYSQSIDHARELYSSKLDILKGIEFSEPHLYPQELEKIQKLDFDLILGSVHMVGNRFVGDYRSAGRDKILQIFEAYYQETSAMVRHGGFDVLAHLDFPVRYFGRNDTFNDFLKEVLVDALKKDIVLEVNTSPFRKGLSEPNPSLALLSIYREIGGRFITMGSDAHQVSDIASDFDAVYGMVERYALQPVVFHKRKHRIIL